MDGIPSARRKQLKIWGWHNPDAAIAQNLRAELEREVPPGHLLFGRPVEVIAYREDQDDVLCCHQGEPDRFTVVHLTWSRKREIDSEHPSVCFDGTFENFYTAEQAFYQTPPES